MFMQITIKTSKKREVVDITDKVQSIISKQGILDGVCTVFVKHTTAAITTADLDPGTDLDLLDAIEKIVPKLKYRHPHDPSHAPDHIAASLIGPSVTVPIENGKLSLGTWQRIILIELDGPRARSITLSF
jgi:secondary thiamine-phosphate synthase enzyme